MGAVHLALRGQCVSVTRDLSYKMRLAPRSQRRITLVRISSAPVMVSVQLRMITRSFAIAVPAIILMAPNVSKIQ